MKKTVSAILAAITVIGLAAFASAAEKSGDYEYRILDDGTVQIEKYVGYSEAGLLAVPEEIDGRRVVSIGREAFQYAKITSVEIGESILSIGDRAFRGCSAVRIGVTGGDVFIGREAFSNCAQLEEFSLAADNAEICEDAFMYDRALTTFTWVPKDVDAAGTDAVIRDRAFCYSGLTAITIPGDEVRIGKEAFSQCGSLKNVTVLGSFVNIGESAFAFSGIEAFRCPNAGVLETNAAGLIGEKAFYASGLKSVVIPACAGKIGENAFTACRNLTDAVIPPTVTDIADNAFIGCDSLSAKVIKWSIADLYCRRVGIAAEYVTEEELTAFYRDCAE